MKSRESDVKNKLRLFLNKYEDIIHFHYSAYMGAPGAPDRIAYIGGVPVMFECKDTKGVLSPRQEQFKAKCDKYGVLYLIVNPQNWDDIKDIINIIYFMSVDYKIFYNKMKKAIDKGGNYVKTNKQINS